MAGTTPNLGLYLPGGGSTGTWTPDEVADIDPVNQNFQKIDAFAGQVGVQANRNQQFYGPASAIASVAGMKLGDEYQESDGQRALWRYDGTNWQTYDQGPGLVKIKPTSVVNGTINPDGSVSFTGITDTVKCSLVGVFSARFRNYRIVMESTLASSGGPGFRLRTAAVDNETANYGNSYIFNSTNTTLQTIYNILTYFATSGIGVAQQFVVADIQAPFLNEVTKFISDSSGLGGTGATCQNTRMSSFFGVSAVFDGLTIFSPTGPAAAGRVSVYGYN